MEKITKARTRSIADIEREIETNRARLAETLDALGPMLTVGGISGQIGGAVRRNGGVLGHAIAATARQNPLATALAATGIGWFIGGPTVRARIADFRAHRRQKEPQETTGSQAFAGDQGTPQNADQAATVEDR